MNKLITVTTKVLALFTFFSTANFAADAASASGSNMNVSYCISPLYAGSGGGGGDYSDMTILAIEMRRMKEGISKHDCTTSPLS